jgi:cytochrome c oxidase subunit 1
VPFSVSTQTNVSTDGICRFILGMSSMLTGLNFITTIHRMRSPKGDGLVADPAVYLVPLRHVLGSGAGHPGGLHYPAAGHCRTLSSTSGFLTRPRAGIPFFTSICSGCIPIRPVYIMILPGMGVISEIIPVFSRKSIFGYKAIVVSSMAIAVAGSLVWAHHMLPAA